eukprot:2333751-Amphidinium_carterae.1
MWQTHSAQRADLRLPDAVPHLSWACHCEQPLLECASRGVSVSHFQRHARQLRRAMHQFE